MDRKYHIWVSQLCGFRRKSRESGYLASDCAMVSRQTGAAKFTLAEVAAIVPTLDYDGCSLVELKVLEASIGAVVAPEAEMLCHTVLSSGEYCSNSASSGSCFCEKCESSVYTHEGD